MGDSRSMSMRGVRLPGGRPVEFAEVPVPAPGHGQVLVKMKASSICGSDIRAIYREHLGHGPEAYQGVIAGHEPMGRSWPLGPAAAASRSTTGYSSITSPDAASVRIAVRAT